MLRLILVPTLLSVCLQTCIADDPAVSQAAKPQEGTKPANKKYAGDRLGDLLLVVSPESKQNLAIREGLTLSCSVNFKKVPLTELLESLGRQWNIQIAVDSKGLEDESIPLDKTITLKADGLTRRSVLTGLLKPDLNYFVVNGTLVISSASKCKDHLATLSYSVRSIVGESDEPDLDSLCDVIRGTVHPDSWIDNGGNGVIMSYDKTASIVVSASEQTHEKVIALLVELRSQRELEWQRIITKPATGASPLEQNLEKVISIKWKQTPLRDALLALAADANLPLLFDEKSLKEQGVSLDIPLTFSGDRILAENALNAIRRIEPKVDLLIDKEMVLVTTSAKVGEKRELRLYNINDLTKESKDGKADKANPARIVDLIKLQLQPNSPADKSELGIKAVQISDVYFLQAVLTQRDHRELARSLREIRERLTNPDVPEAVQQPAAGGAIGIGEDGTLEE